MKLLVTDNLISDLNKLSIAGFKYSKPFKFTNEIAIFFFTTNFLLNYY